MPVDDLLPFLVLGEDLDAADATGDPASEGAASVGGRAASPPPAASTAPGFDGSETEGAPGAPEPSGEGVADAPSEIVVHVSGAVRRPGVVTVAGDARVFEAIDLAGGAEADADLDRVNLAAPLVDGERIHVPAQGEDIPEVVQSSRPAAPSMGEALPTVSPMVDINTASVSELETLPGVGPAIASAIVQTREDRGPFLSVDELLEVPGIGDAKLAQIRPLAVVGR